jgi:hypothetical protein
MPNHRSRVMAAMSVLALPVVMNIGQAQADPLPDYCVPPSVVDNVCSARLTSVTADVVNGTVTGTPVGGGTAITLAGQEDAYLKSAGFEVPLPDAVQRWDAAIDGVKDVDPSDPNWYGNAKARAFLPRTLNDLATQFPPDVLMVRFAPDDAASGSFRLVSIQPTPPPR